MPGCERRLTATRPEPLPLPGGLDPGAPPDRRRGGHQGGFLFLSSSHRLGAGGLCLSWTTLCPHCWVPLGGDIQCDPQFLRKCQAQCMFSFLVGLRAPGSRAKGIEENSTVAAQGRLSRARSFPWHPREPQRKHCCYPHDQRVGLLGCIWKVLSLPHILCPVFLFTPFSKVNLGKAQGNKAIHFHKIYHLLNGASVARVLFTSCWDGRTQQLLAPNSTARRPRRV